MCAQRIQRLFQAILLGLIMGIAADGFAGDKMMLQVAFLMQLSMMVMLAIAGITSWCPGLKLLKKIFPDCNE